MDRRILIITLVLVVSTISFLRSFLGLIGIIPWHYGYSDVFNVDRINPELTKKIPYLESQIEYPIITGFFIYFMWFLGKSLLGYVALTYVFLTLAAIITALVLYKLADLLKIGKERLFWFFIFAPSLAFFGVYNWDIIAVMLMVVAMYFFYKNQYMWTAIFLSLGFNAKLFPVVLLPIMLLKTDIKNATKMVLLFLATFLLLNGYFIVNSFDVWKTTYLFHSTREPNIDSIWALTGLGTKMINLLSMILFLLLYLALVFNHKKYDLVSLSFSSLLLFLFINKVFSPQYALWLLPFFVLSQNVTRTTFYYLEAANLIVFFSTQYWVLVSKKLLFLMISNVSVVARSLILAYIIYAMLTIKKQKGLNST